MISLYEHNRAAYEAAARMLAETGRAAIIHPTGTGKSFIGLKLAAENPGSRVCWLSPSEHIFETQIENLKARGCDAPDNIGFMTYAKLMACGEAEIAKANPRFIVLDEFHRVGARQWGRGVRRLLSACPDARVLGLSATSIRYLDSRRDMAAELFGESVASRMSLGEAIVRGILPPPAYITSVYSCQRQLARLRARAERNPGGQATKRLEELRRALDRADGLGEIFKKHMKRPAGKYIAFCSGLGHMRDMMARVPEWFSGGAARVYAVHSDDPASRREFAGFRNDSSGRLRLLFCIDMLNEGVHVDDVDGVILFRPTMSPIVYKQQIGRALAAGRADEPVIFDIVNNFESLCSIDSVEEEMRAAARRLREAGQEGSIVNESFLLVDEARDCRDIFEQLERSLSASWDAMFALAKRFYEERGHLLVPRAHKAGGASLGLWVDTQRKVRRGRIPGNLSAEQARRLESIGMVWENNHERGWELSIREARRFYAEHGHLDAGIGCRAESGFGLGSWLASLRRRRNAGERLPEDRVGQLDAMGMVWDRHGLRFESNFKMAEEYFAKHGHLEADPKTEDGRPLSQWLQRARRARERGGLDGAQIARLDALGMRWGKKADLAWEENYRRAAEYHRRHGHIDAPLGYVTEDGFELGKWLYGHRRAHRGSHRAAVSLTEERRAKLDALGMVWGK